MSRKRALVDATWPETKRQLIEAVKSLASSFTRKRQREDPDDNDQSFPKQAVDGSQGVINPKNRMDIYEGLHTFRTWKECYETLNLLPNGDLRTVAWMITDLPEWARLRALRELRNNHNARYWKIINLISEMQMNKSSNDPNSLFPCVFTREYGYTILSPARRCYHCNKEFEEGATMVWKSCGKHTMHIKCLSRLLEDESYEPLVGYCPCI